MSRRNGPALALLADLTRRRIIALLAMRPSRPSTVANLVPLSRSAATRHLRLLEEAGIVVAQPLMLDGRAILYKLNPLARGAITAFLAGTRSRLVSDRSMAMAASGTSHGSETPG